MNQLIASVKQYPELYNPNHADYKDHSRKSSLWSLISSELLLDDGESARSKWRNLRDSYVKYLRNNTKPYSSSANRRYKNWPWAEQMEFLRPYVANKWPELAAPETKSESLSEEEGNFTIHEDPGVSSVGPSRSKRKKDSAKARYSAPIPKFDGYLNDCLFQDSDADDLLFLSYSKTLKTFSKRRQMLVKMEISRIMLEAEMVQATEDEQVEIKCEAEEVDGEPDVVGFDAETNFVFVDENPCDDD